VVLTDIYAAGESPIPGATVNALAEAMRTHVRDLHVVPSLADVPAHVSALVRDGDLVLTLGAGSIGGTGDRILANWKGRRHERRIRRSRRGLPAAAAGIPVPSDKRFRRSDVRPARRRNWRRTLVRASWITGAAVMSVGFLVWVVGLVIDSPVLRVNNIVPSGNARLTKAAVESQLVGIRDEALLRVDLESTGCNGRCRRGSNPRSCGACCLDVHVRIVERKPLVLGRFGGQLYLIDAEGVVIDLMGPQYSDLDLPVVDGLAAA
jgi:hypothetical protein